MALKEPLKLHNTLSGQTEEFVPLASPVKMYNCGPTVYDRQHIGNLRGYIFADMLRRTLALWGYKVDQVINITDVGHLVSDADQGEDKMEKAAKAKGKSAQEIAQEVTQWWFEDLDLVGIDRKKIKFPRATEYIEEQVALVQALEEKGYAYKIDDGIYFDTLRFPDYGKLGSIDLSGQEAGARVEENMQKKNQHDFALWKFSKKREKRQQEWPSPWGTGFPGWHIECTAMIFKLLGKQIDIHTGGVDHIPVHHNNEIAQAESITHKQYVKYWLHNEFITIEGKKISKSLGNTVYVHNLLDRGLEPRALRYWYLTGHYRSPMNFTWDAIGAADQTLLRLRRLYLELPRSTMVADKAVMDDVYKALAQDINTPQVIARMWEMLRDEKMPPTVKRSTLVEIDKILGLGLGEEAKIAKLSVLEQKDLPQNVQDILTSREEARKNKDYTLADTLRAEIEAAGYDLTDTSEGQRVTKK